MSDGSNKSADERRGSDRVPFQGRVLLRASGWEALNQYLTENLSTDGMFVEHPKPLAAGETVELKVIDDDGKPLFEATGTVTWVREASEGSPLPAGMGVHFTWLSDDSKQAVQRIVRANPKARNRKIGGARGSAPKPAPGTKPPAAAAAAPKRPTPPATQPKRPEPAAAPEAGQTTVGPPPKEQPAPAAKEPAPPPKKKPRIVSPQKKVRPGSPLGFVSGLQAAVSQSSPAVLIGAAVGALALLAGIGLTIHFIGVQKTKNAYRDALQADAQRIEEAIASLDTAQAGFAEREKDLAAAERNQRTVTRGATLSAQQVLTINRTMRRAVGGRTARFRLTSMRRAGRTDDGPLRRVTYDMELYGDVLRLDALVNALFAHEKAMVVQSFEVSTLSFNTTQCRIKARVYFFEDTRPTKPPPVTEPPAAYLSLLTPKPVSDEWQGLDNEDIQSAQDRLASLRTDLEQRREIVLRRATLDQRAELIDAKKVAVERVRAERDESHAALEALAPQLMQRARTSADGVASARIDPTGKLTLW